jgi:hypothetical protein
VDEHLQKALLTFGGNVRLVYELMDFDRVVQDRALGILKDVQNAVGDDLKYTAQLRLSNGIQAYIQELSDRRAAAFRSL